MGCIERQNLAKLYDGIKGVKGGSGCSTIAPETLFALWLYATLDGAGVARAIARLTEQHDAYRGICGGVQVNHHTLADCRPSPPNSISRRKPSRVSSATSPTAV